MFFKLFEGISQWKKIVDLKVEFEWEWYKLDIKNFNKNRKLYEGIIVSKIRIVIFLRLR
jgi:hypothetical protein